MLTYEEFCEQPMEYVAGISFDWGASRMYRNNELGIQREVITKRIRNDDIYSGWYDPKEYLFLDGVEGEHANLACLYEAYMRKVCGVEE